MTSTIRALCCAIALLAAPAAAQAAGDAVAGKAKAYTCLGCHGIEDYKNVYPTYHVPKLAGQNAEYIVAALTAYAIGERTHETMHSHAASLSAEDIQDIAAYFATSGQ